YKNQPAAAPAPRREPSPRASAAPEYAAIAASFPEDEPLFASMEPAPAAPMVEEHLVEEHEEIEEKTASERERDHEDEKLDRADLAPVIDEPREEMNTEPLHEEHGNSEPAM